MKDELQELIKKGQTFTFDKNSTFKSDEFITKASNDLLRWISKVEKMIASKCATDSAPYVLYNSFEMKYLNGYPELYFNLELSILNQALKSCARKELKTSHTVYYGGPFHIVRSNF